MDNNNLTEWIEGLTLATDKAEPREDIMLFPFGEFDHPSYGKMIFDNDFFNEIIKNYQDGVMHTKPFMDMQHDENKSLAWFDSSPFIRPGQGLFVKPDYTELGRNMLKTRTYRYFSPSWGPYTDPQTGKKFKNVLRGGAATNIPFLKIMPSIIDETAVLTDKDMVNMKLTDLTTNGSSIPVANGDDGKGEQTPKQSNNNTGENMKKIISKLNLSEDATEDAIVTKIEELMSANTELSGKVDDIEKKIDGDKSLSDELNETKKKLNDVTVRLTEGERDKVINKALSEGRLNPADKEYWEKRYMSDPVNVGQDLEKLPKVVDFSETGKGGEGQKDLTDDPGAQMVAEATKLVADGKAKDLSDAYAQIGETNPKLVESYNAKYHS
jgi:phage I-like protein